jgi:non-ribosomal peptide synthetase component F/thioesterase domain-containing protein
LTSTAALLDELAARGVELWLEGDRVRYRGPAGAVPPPLMAQLREGRAALIAELRERLGAARENAPASWNQVALWLAQEALPGSDACHMGVAFRITSPIEDARLRAALQAVVDRHGSLRTTFVPTDDALLQAVAGYQPVDFARVDVAGETDDGLSRLVHEAYRSPFDLSDVVFRARLFVRAIDDAVLLLVVHRIATDATSLWLAIEEVFDYYRSHESTGDPPRSRPEVQYLEFADWQRQLLASADGARLREYWTTCLAGSQPLAGLGDRPRTAQMSASGTKVTWHVDRQRTDRLKAFAATQRTSLFVVLLAVFKALLFRHTGQTDVVVASPTLGRSRAEFMGLVGDVANTVAFRTALDGAPSFRALVARVRETALAALKHADYPYALLVRELGVRRDAGRMPVTDVFFDFQSPQSSNRIIDMFLTATHGEQISAAGLTLAPYVLEARDVQFDLAQRVVERDGLHCSLHYRADLFAPATIERFVADWTRAVDTIIESPDESIAEFAAGTLDDIAECAHTTPPIDTTSIDQRVIDQASATPDRVAVADEREQLTYAQLVGLASGVALALEGAGVAPGMRVAVLLPPSTRLVAALLGVFKVGAACVRLDEADSWSRHELALSGGNVSCLIVDRSMAAALGDAQVPVCVINECCESAASRPAVARADDVACWVRVPGSTRDVGLTHRAIAAGIAATQDRFGADDPLRSIVIYGTLESSTLTQLLAALCHGGSVLLASPGQASDGRRLAQLIDRWQPTLLQLPSAAWRTLLRAGWRGSPRLAAVVDDDGLDGHTASALVASTRHTVRAVALPESAGAVIATELPAAETVLGRPLRGIEAYVLTPAGRPAAAGTAGELWVSGTALARDDSGTDGLGGRFRCDPFNGPGTRMCSTGMIARWREDGTLECLGRLDARVRIRGRVVDMSDVEEALGLHPIVCRAAVCASTGVDGEPRLVAFIETAEHLRAGDLRRFLHDRLPEHAIPAAFTAVAALPLTVGGEVDRRRLPAPPRDAERVIVGPRTALERQLVGLWEELLEASPISVTDSFFDLGGHSMLAARMCARIGQSLGRRVHIATLFQAPTLEQLAERLEREGVSVDALIVPIRSGGAGRPYFCVPGAGDNPFIFSDLAARLAPDRPIYSFRLPDPPSARDTSPGEALAQAAEALVREMRGVDPTGPYLLGGYCLGGLLVFEMARQLQEAGQTVAALTIFETYLPGGVRQARWRDRLAHQWTHARTLDWPGRVEFVRRMTTRRLVRMVRGRSARLGEVMAPLAARGDYVPRHVFSGRLTLFRAHLSEPGALAQHEMGWRGLARAITVHEISGHHTDAYKEPQLSAWVELLRGTLRRADAGGGVGPVSA